jgi:proteasome lid subunit RPN8/RPN11
MVTWKTITIAEPLLHDRADFAAARRLPADVLLLDPLIAFRDGAWDDLLQHVNSATVEVGGMLLGEVFRDEDGRIALDILHAIPALGAKQEPTYYKLTDEAWDHICKVRDEIDPDMLILGWYHSHPNLGAFYSGTDRASQKAFYNRPWNLGLVIDPYRHDLALFLGGDSARIGNGHLVSYWLRVIDPPQPPLPPEEPRYDWRLNRPFLAASMALGFLSAALLRRIWGGWR